MNGKSTYILNYLLAYLFVDKWTPLAKIDPVRFLPARQILSR